MVTTLSIPVLKKHWPNVRAITTPSVVKHMETQLTPARFEGLWLKYFPGDQIAQPQVPAESTDSNTFHIDRHECRAVEVGHSDTYDMMVLYVPSIHLVVAGDVVYGDVHQFFGEANTTEKRKEWLRTLDTFESLNPHTVIAGHKRAGTVDGTFNLQSTREYIFAFEDAVKTSSKWEDLFAEIKDRYPGRINLHAILARALVAFPAR
ncbi:hypothetical protein PV05_02109 [Exophiala xenobiotica]|jgi:glyoxylase-like metal-dependent hydrolase (beta-lactamase superfamily II)|uniref:Metallo-beta-lactamase domain-containing protein n=1 Tax=Exophiala xenobiotica TaxID=348802 RepID=A0A0D2DID5_9EURO|nr:uncharacterized protein PV05_02109 [Exophiala xenobiotica]KIW62057.1 hypothetical protein PV05_02109 [Exophiala xenobiotica]